MKSANTRLALNACAVIVCLASCDKPTTPDGGSSPKLEAKQLASTSRPAAFPANEVKAQPINHPSAPEESEVRITQMLSKARNSNLPRSERMAALNEIAVTNSEAATNALVALISLASSDEDERRVSATGSMASRYPALEAIKARGTAAVPSMCERLLSLTANGGDSSEVRLICMTALTLDSLETINTQLTSAAGKGGHSAMVLQQARSLVESFAKRFPTANR